MAFFSKNLFPSKLSDNHSIKYVQMVYFKNKTTFTPGKNKLLIQFRYNIHNKLKKTDIMKKTEKKVFGTQEWAKRTKNFISGCTNNCKYCYAKEMAVRFGRKTTCNWTEEEVNYKKLKVNPRKASGYTMFPSTHDITPENLNNSIFFLEKLLKSGSKVLIVTKPHLEVIKRICSEFEKYKENILLRLTIGSVDSEILKFWEPNAPSFEERLAALRYAYNNGYATSVSCEPILDIDVKPLLNELLPYVTDAIWIGTANKLIQRLRMNGLTDEETFKKAKILIESQSASWINEIYHKWKGNRHIKWKESIKKVVGIKVSTIAGSDN